MNFGEESLKRTQIGSLFVILIEVILVIMFYTFPLYSDEAVKKNGKILTNVRAIIKRKTVRIEYENGLVEEINKKEFRSVKIMPVIWTSLMSLPEEEKKVEEEKEKERVMEASVNGNEWEFRPEEDQINPWQNAMLGIIPGYSGLYRTNNYWGGGILTTLEIIALLNFVDVAGAKKVKLTQNDYLKPEPMFIASTYGTFFFNLPPEDPTSIPPGLIIYHLMYGRSTWGYNGLISDRTIVPIDQSKRIYAQELRNATVFLGSILAIDSILSYFSASSWNEGTFKGEKSKRPTTRLSRLGRSFFFPGWGQIYGGETIKGYSYLVIGLGLLGNVAFAESNAANAYRRYKDVPQYAATTNSVPLLILRMSTFRSYREAVFDAVEQRNKAWTYYGVFWAWNLFDAVFLSGTNKLDGKISLAPNVSYQGGIAANGRIQLESFYSLNLIVEF